MKRIKSYTALLFIASVLLSSNCYATLDIELTEGVNKAQPIAVIPFAGINAITNPDQKVSDVIKHDLAISGQFNVSNASDPQHQPDSPKAIDYHYWRQQHVDDVVVGQIKPLGFNQYQVTVALVDLYRGVMSPTKVLINKKFTVPKQQLRGLAHHISDLIYQKLLGQKGIFSTRMAYILVTPKSKHVNQYALEVADMDGYNAQPILRSQQPIMSPAWSPDGKRLAYVSFESSLPQIYVSDIASGKRTRITSFPGINGAPAWSPDGKKLAVALSMQASNPNIYVVDLSNGKLTQITHDWSINTEPAWDPKGDSIIFTSDRGGSPQIYRVNLADQKVSRVSFNGNYNAKASFLPDGNSLVLLHRSQQEFNIAILDIKSNAVLDLTKAGQNESPTIAPNGKMVAYATQYKGHGVLGMVSIDGKVKLRLPDMQGNVQEPAWSPYLS